jgi:transcriptional regulator with XRE-family HTH domain
MPKKTGLFASRLRELRERAGLTQAELAAKSGLHLHGLTKLEHGDREPSWRTIQALADALAVTCDELRKPAAAITKARRGRPPKLKAATPARRRSRGRLGKSDV